MTCCGSCGAQIIMTAYGTWRMDVPTLRLAGLVYFCTEACRDAYLSKLNASKERRDYGA